MITELAIYIQHSFKSLVTLTNKPGFILAEQLRPYRLCIWAWIKF